MRLAQNAVNSVSYLIKVPCFFVLLPWHKKIKNWSFLTLFLTLFDITKHFAVDL